MNTSPPLNHRTAGTGLGDAIQVAADLSHAAIQAAATQASEAALFEGWKEAPEVPLSDVQRQHNRREINRAVMRLQHLAQSPSFGVRTDADHDFSVRLGTSIQRRRAEDNTVDFVQKAKAARAKARRKAARAGQPKRRLVMPVSKKRRRSSEDIGSRSGTSVYKIAQTDGDLPAFLEGTAGLQRPLHGLWKNRPSMTKERWHAPH